LGDEVAGYARALLGAVPVDDEAVALAEIAAADPGGDHLGSKMTRAHHRDFWQPSPIDHNTHDRWLRHDGRTLLERVRARLQELLAEGPAFALDAASAATVDRLAGIRTSWSSGRLAAETRPGAIMPVIEVEDLSKRFGRKVLAVDDVSFSVAAGTITGFLGPNGAGKTTIMRMLVDLVRPTSGRVTVLDGRYRDLTHPTTRVGALLDASGFHPGRSGRNALRVVARAAGIGYNRVDSALEMVELSGAAGRAVKGYSTGMKQRLALACALLGDPEVLLLDEPANGLDPEGMKWLRGFLRAQAAEGRTVLISSHVLAEIEQTVDHVLIISKGKLLARGPISQLAAGAAAVVRVRSPQAQKLEGLLLQKGAGVNRLDTALAIRGPSSAEVGELAHANDIVLHELLAEQPSLEDLFLQIAGTRRES